MKYFKYKFFLFSEDPDKLVTFYTDVLGFRIIKKLEYPKDYGYTLEVAPGYEVWLAKHSEVSGINKDFFRHMINIYVDNVDEIYQKVKDSKEVTVVQAPIKMSEFVPNETRSVCTILDPEGNCLQFMGDLDNSRNTN